MELSAAQVAAVDMAANSCSSHGQMICVNTTRGDLSQHAAALQETFAHTMVSQSVAGFGRSCGTARSCVAGIDWRIASPVGSRHKLSARCAIASFQHHRNDGMYPELVLCLLLTGAFRAHKQHLASGPVVLPWCVLELSTTPPVHHGSSCCCPLNRVAQRVANPDPSPSQG